MVRTVPWNGPSGPLLRRRRFGLAGEPGETDRDAAADGLAEGEGGGGTHEDDRFLAGGLPGGDVAAQEIDAAGGGGSVDVGAGQAAFVAAMNWSWGARFFEGMAN